MCSFCWSPIAWGMIFAATLCLFVYSVPVNSFHPDVTWSMVSEKRWHFLHLSLTIEASLRMYFLWLFVAMSWSCTTSTNPCFLVWLPFLKKGISKILTYMFIIQDVIVSAMYWFRCPFFFFRSVLSALAKLLTWSYRSMYWMFFIVNVLYGRNLRLFIGWFWGWTEPT